jgi:hypothetical protein
MTNDDTDQVRLLREDMLTFMRGLALTRKRRLAIGTLRRLAGTPLFTAVLRSYLAQTSYEEGVQPLRNVVHGEFLEPPPKALTDLVRPR